MYHVLQAHYYLPLVEYVRDISKDRDVVLTGHSLGGGLARIVGALEKWVCTFVFVSPLSAVWYMTFSGAEAATLAASAMVCICDGELFNRSAGLDVQPCEVGRVVNVSVLFLFSPVVCVGGGWWEGRVACSRFGYLI